MKKLTPFWRRSLGAILSICLSFIVLACLLFLYLESQLPNVDSLKNVQLQVPLRIYTKDGLLIQEYGETKRIPVSYNEIPELLVKAILATEDQRFFEHPGVDVVGLGRALVRMIQTGTKSQGGSTITMQVARNFFLDRKKTFLRKFNEILLAIKIDKELSKEKVLELYLNKIYLGNRSYGIGAAAQVYYGKSLKELTLAEIAMIAGLPQAPSTQNPIANPIAAKKRRDHVLSRLFEEKYISQDDYKKAINTPLTATYHGATIEIEAPYVAEMIRQSLFEHFGADAYSKGYKVYTTIDSKLQNHAASVVARHLLNYDKRHGYRGAVANIGGIDESSIDTIYEILEQYPIVNNLQPAVILNIESNQATAIAKYGKVITLEFEGVSWARKALKEGKVDKSPSNISQVVKIGDIVYVTENANKYSLSQLPQIEAAFVAINPKDGSIKALLGGFNFEKSKFNRATQASRQPGSSFKPFVYAAALNKNYSLATLVNDAPIVIDDPSQANLWRPHNHNLKFNGPTRLKEALIHSSNLVSIRVLDDIGIDYAIDYLTNFGFLKKNLPYALSLALGSLSVSPLEISQAYAVFANGGYKIEPYLINQITDNDGNILLQAKPSTVPNELAHHDIDEEEFEAPQVISKDIVFLINSALKDVMKRGTARSASVLKRDDIAGKTGTTNDQVDAWFAGYNPDLVVTTWMGFDNPEPIHEYATTTALPIWIDFMKFALKGMPEKPQSIPDNIVSVRINPTTGLLAHPNHAEGVIEFFRRDEVPESDIAHAHQGQSGHNEGSDHLF